MNPQQLQLQSPL